MDQELFQLLSDKKNYELRRALNKQLEELLGVTADKIREKLKGQPSSLEKWFVQGPKISRGENYKGYPWMVLDYPRNYSNQSILSVRCMCWYGHYFSAGLLISGEALHEFGETVNRNLPRLAQSDFRICSKPHPWIHEIDEENYILTDIYINQPEHYKYIAEIPFIKLAKRIDLNAIHSFPDEASEIADRYINLLY